ncbi:MAG: glycosyltransferase [Leptolyngbyaceae cyanobacterium SM1_4_3]|nr:glycosyltransferase [Leptolyngbyaceae cyanobacterium SM1_4_3]
MPRNWLSRNWLSHNWASRRPSRNPCRFSPSGSLPATAIIVPAYNEAENIQQCLTAAIESSPADCSVWLIDDQSTDETVAIAQLLQESLQDPRLHILEGQPRPQGERWVGKNWACVQAAEQISSEYLLFIDADVRLKPGAIETVVQVAEAEQADLLTLVAEIECGCWAEWIVQPLMVSTLLLAYDFAAVNDPESETAFGAGPFMLFRRSTYEQIGGHRAVADQVVEDVELSRRVKFSGLKLKYLQGNAVANVRMYRSWGALWEGWTKNFYLGAQRNFKGMVRFIVLMLLIYLTPWIGLGTAISQAVLDANILTVALFSLSLAGIGLHYRLRQILAQSGISSQYWWLSGAGGIAVAAIAIGSIIKTETGWGWTWRGRSLAR